MFYILKKKMTTLILMIPEDDVTPIDMDGDSKPDEVEKEVRTEPEESSVGSSLLSRIKKELPSKVEEATQGEE